MNRRTFTKLAGAAGLSTSVWGGAVGQTAGEPTVAGSLSLESGAAPVAFNPMIFGQFLEHFQRQVYGGVFDPGSSLSNRTGLRLDVIEALKELRVPIVRWPGGCFVSGYHWQDGVGKVRQPSFNKAWGVTDPNTFGTDEFVVWCRLIGAEPYICTNAGTGTEEEMSDWVEYCNLREGRYAAMRMDRGHPEPYNVKYWSIGNENYFSTEIGSKTIEQWGPLVRVAAQLMRAVTPDLQLLAAANTSSEWTAPMLKAAGKSLNYISIHRYFDILYAKGSTPSDYLHCMARSQQPEETMVKAIQILKDNGFDGRIKVAFDEWNLRSWYHPGFPGGGAGQTELIRERDKADDNSIYTMADAIFSAGFLHCCLRHPREVQMACMAPVVNVRGPLFVHPKGIVKRTTFHTMKMYATLLEPNVVPVTVASEKLSVGKDTAPVLDAVLTVSNEGRRYAAALINRDPARPAVWTLPEGAARPQGNISLTVLSGDSPDAYNDIARPNRVEPKASTVSAPNGTLTLPAHSITIARYSA